MANGITLRADYGPYIVTAISPTQHFYTDTGLSSAVTLPATITATTTWYCAPAYSDFYTFTCTQLDGSDISPGVPQWVGTTADSTLNPRPSSAQVSADAGFSLITPRLKSGYYYYTASQSAAGTSATLGVNILRVVPWLVPHTLSIVRLGAEITSAGDAGSKLRLGIWADDGSGYPSTLVLDAGQIAGDSNTVQELTVSATLDKGWYWVGGVVQSVSVTQPTVRITSHTPTSMISPSAGTIPSANQSTIGFQQTGVSGAFGASFTGSNYTTTAPRVFIKVA